ncbi:MAG: DNRLRE domain-containing protein, partial [Oscillospiraceae bacterium]|nr:DNRLRE domain-containing protein [Oscillospiraceae bacterium]
FLDEEDSQTPDGGDGQTDPVTDTEAELERVFTDAGLNKNAVIKEPEDLEALPENERKIVAGKAGSGLAYNDILGDGADARYTLSPGKLKEDVILNAPCDFAGYSMDISMGGLTPVMDENNSVNFTDEDGETVFILQTPYMYDAEYDTSYDIVIEIDETEDGYRIIFTPDAEWLNSDERVYPIVIDPVVTSPTNTANAHDTYVYEGGGNTGWFGQYLHIGIKSVSSTYKIHKSYWRIITLPALPSGAVINNATFKIQSPNGSTGRVFSLYGVNSGLNGNWTESTLTWANQPTSFSLLIDKVGMSAITYSVNFTGANVTARVREWYSGAAPNYGFMIRYTNEGKDLPVYTSFYSCDSGSSYTHPYLTITYNESAHIANGTYFIKNQSTGRYLDVYSGSSASGTKVWQYPFNGSKAQQWTVTNAGNGVYSLKPGTNSSLRLDVSGGADLQNQAVQVYTDNCTPAQFWRVIKSSNGIYRLMPENSGTRVLAVRGGTASNKDDAVIVTYTGASVQNWVFEKATQYGGASSGFRDVKGKKDDTLRCFGYVLEMTYSPELIMNYGESVETVFGKTKTKIESLNSVNGGKKRCTRLDSKDSWLRPDEYKVAMRVGSHNLLVEKTHGYHFIVQLNNGRWAEKAGDKDSKDLGAVNPDTMNWGLVLGIDRYYNSDTIYFAVTK